MKTMRKVTLGLSALLLGQAGMPGIAAAQLGGPPADPSTSMVSYVLGPRDIVDISVVGRADYRTQVQIQEDGTIALPLIGIVNAATMTVPQLRVEIQRRLSAGGFFVKPEIIVTLITASSQYAILLGDFGSPGLITLDREYRLSEVLARGAGARTGSDVVFMTSPGGETREYSMRALATNKTPDPIVTAGSKILVQASKVYYVYGQIGSPGGFPVEDGMTLRQALARAGGITSLGSTKKVKIYRGDQVIKRAEMTSVVQPGDTIVVGERFF